MLKQMKPALTIMYRYRLSQSLSCPSPFATSRSNSTSGIKAVHTFKKAKKSKRSTRKQKAELWRPRSSHEIRHADHTPAAVQPTPDTVSNSHESPVSKGLESRLI